MTTSTVMTEKLAKAYDQVEQGTLDIKKAETLKNIVSVMIRSALAVLKQHEFLKQRKEVPFLKV